MASTFSTYIKKELIKKLKNQKTFLIIQSVVIILMLVFGVFSTIEKGMSFHTFLPLFFIPMLFVMLYEMKKIKKEIATRK
jgi:Na+/proline symporter